MTKKMRGAVRNRSQRGYTLLEYCAGAALIAGVVWVALSSMGQNVSDLLNGIGQWAQRRNQEISQ